MFCNRLQYRRLMWEQAMTNIGIGLVGGGYMGKAHAVAL
jgi:ribosomal protein S9